jgi:hypothetical protein
MFKYYLDQLWLHRFKVRKAASTGVKCASIYNQILDMENPK